MQIHDLLFSYCTSDFLCYLFYIYIDMRFPGHPGEIIDMRFPGHPEEIKDAEYCLMYTTQQCVVAFLQKTFAQKRRKKD